MSTPNPILRDEDCCPASGRYPDGKADGTYSGAVGGWDALWHEGWVAHVERRATGSTRRWRVLGYLQVAQAILAQPGWPIEDAVCALKRAVHHYRRWAEATERVGDARDAHDIARYLYHPRVTQDGQPFLRAGLGAQEEGRRRTFALRVLRVAQCDVARWIEATSPMDHRAHPLSTALRVPGLPLDWRTNPYVPDWRQMPYGFTRPLVALEMVAAGIVRFPYTFVKRDPTLRDWPRSTDLVDDVVDAIKDAWDSVADLISEATDWICRNSELVSACVTGVAVAAEIAATGGTDAPAVLATAYEQYAAVHTGITTVCGGIAVARGVNFLLDWDGQIARIARGAATATAFPSAIAAEAPRARTPDEMAQALFTAAQKKLEKAARPLVEGLLRSFQRGLQQVAQEAGGEPAKAFLARFDDWGPLVDVVVARAKQEATNTLRQYIALRVANAHGTPANAINAQNRLLRQVYKDVAAVQAATGPRTAARDRARHQVLTGRGSGYGGAPSTSFEPAEQSTIVQNAQLVGLQRDAINEVLYGPGPQDDGVRPQMRDAAPALTARMMSALTGGGAEITAPFVELPDDTAAIREARVALRVARASRMAVDFPGFRVSVQYGTIAFVPRTMLSSSVSAYPTRFGVSRISVTPSVANTMYGAIAAEDRETLATALRRNANTPLIGVFYACAGTQLLAAARRRTEKKRTEANTEKKVDGAAAARQAAQRRQHAAEFKRSRQRSSSKALPLLAVVGVVWWLR